MRCLVALAQAVVVVLLLLGSILDGSQVLEFNLRTAKFGGSLSIDVAR